MRIVAVWWTLEVLRTSSLKSSLWSWSWTLSCKVGTSFPVVALRTLYFVLRCTYTRVHLYLHAPLRQRAFKEEYNLLMRCEEKFSFQNQAVDDARKPILMNPLGPPLWMNANRFYAISWRMHHARSIFRQHDAEDVSISVTSEFIPIFPSWTPLSGLSIPRY